jgi:dTDP-4-amino-4,6-dideoxygalactose transaminase
MPAIVAMADPVREYEELSDEIDAALLRVARSGRYVRGPEHDAFEIEFAEYVGADHAVAVANGTDALEIALRAVGCGAGDEVVTVANAGGFTTAAAQVVGAIPAFVDVSDGCLLADPRQVASSLSPRTAAVVITHLFGHLHPQIEELSAICAKAAIPLIEDCAQATGARIGTRHAGRFGAVAVHSFYPTKNLGALGDAGMVTTDDARLAHRARVLRNYGRVAAGDCVEADGGRNSRLDEVQAAVLRIKLRRVEDMVHRRRRIASCYRAAAPTMWWAGCDGSSYSAHLAVTRSPDRDRFRSEASAAGVRTAVHFPRPDHLPGGPARSTLPVTEAACTEVVSVPCHPTMTDEEVGRVIDFLTRWQDVR